jgi:hypothetical protein
VESVVGASRQEDAVWVLLEPIPSCSIERLLSSAEVTVQQRAILALDLLAGLAELQAMGLGHERLNERTVIVDTEGRLRLTEPWRLPGETVDPRNEVRRAGDLACWILGVGVQPGGSLTPAEQQAPALVAVARSLAVGTESKASDAFQALREAAGRLSRRESLEPSRAGLSRLARSFVGMPAPPLAAAPPVPPPQVSVPVGPAYAPVAPFEAAPELVDLDEGPDIAGPPQPSRSRPPQAPRQPPTGPPAPPSQPPYSSAYGVPYKERRRFGPRVPIVAIAAAAIAGLLLLLLVVVPALLHLAQRTTPGASTSQSRGPSSAATAPPATPTQPQQRLGGAVTSFQLTPQGNCQPGARCDIRVQVNIQRQAAQTEVTWQMKVTDVCHGNATTTQPGSSVTAQAGWPFVFGIDPVALPNSGQVRVVAVTSSPADATSEPLTIGSGC